MSNGLSSIISWLYSGGNPSIINFVRRDKSSSSPSSSSIAEVAVGAAAGLIGCYYLSGAYFALAGQEKWIFVGLGTLLGGVVGYGVSLSFSLTDIVILSALAAAGLGAYLFLKDSTGAVIAASPAIISALPALAV
jgi:hypothetical protein